MSHVATYWLSWLTALAVSIQLTLVVVIYYAHIQHKSIHHNNKSNKKGKKQK